MNDNYIYIIAATILWINNYPRIKLFERKPFNCELCIAFWLTFVYELCNDKSIGIVCVVALITPIINQVYKKILRWSLK